VPRILNRSRVLQGGTRSKRNVTWSICSNPTDLSNVVAGAKSIAVLVPSSTLLDLIPFTITRTIGVVHIESDQSAASERQVGAYGMGIVNDVAGALGITAIPGPAIDCGWSGWFVHGYFFESILFKSAVGTQNLGGNYSFDSRAQRKVSAEEDLVFVVENRGTAFDLNFGVSFRMLIKAG